jgi:D-sedoheptulose 7-phosphate isomerase
MTNTSYFNYVKNLSETFQKLDPSLLDGLAEDLWQVWKKGKQLFLCGNGGSAANAAHLANDFIYGIAKSTGMGIRVNALSANTSILTCLANDVSYESVFSQQLKILGNPGDVIIALSGSGNSPNILKVLEQAKESKIKSYAILGFQGGKAKALADVPLHFSINDMQISEDLQMLVGHIMMQTLSKRQEKEQK